MMLFINMNARVTLGGVRLGYDQKKGGGIASFEISESIDEISNTAKITIPKAYGPLNGRHILDQFKVGDPVTIEAGYNGEYAREFTGYIREIDSDVPLTIYCDDQTWPLRQNNLVKSYRAVTLQQLLQEILPEGYAIEAPAVDLGKLVIDNESSYAVLLRLMSDYGLYSRIQNNHLHVGLAYDYGARSAVHTYIINAPAEQVYKGNVKKNELKYKRKSDFKIRFKAIAINGDGTKTEVMVGSRERDASERTLHFIGPMTEAQLKSTAESVMSKLVYDGYTGSIAGFGVPRTHAGDALFIEDRAETCRSGKYLIEKVEITYGEEGFTRKNSLSCKI